MIKTSTVKANRPSNKLSMQECSVALTVSDNGVGIPDKIKNKIFDPFFTTKKSRKGVGLGLTTVFGIVKQHGGNIEVDSKPGVGTNITTIFQCNENGMTERIVHKHPECTLYDEKKRY